MVPALNDGDYAVARRLRSGQVPAVGDIVEVDHPDLGPLVKRVEALRAEAVRLRGLGASSLEPGQLGWVPRGRVRARLLWRLSRAGLSRIRPYEDPADARRTSR